MNAATITRILRREVPGGDLFTSRSEPSIGVVRVSQRYVAHGAARSGRARRMGDGERS